MAIPPAKQYPISETTKPQRGRPPIYPWDTWLIPDVTTELVEGKHFSCSPKTMMQAIRDRAKKMNLSVSVFTTHVSDGISRHVVFKVVCNGKKTVEGR